MASQKSILFIIEELLSIVIVLQKQQVFLKDTKNATIVFIPDLLAGSNDTFKYNLDEGVLIGGSIQGQKFKLER